MIFKSNKIKTSKNAKVLFIIKERKVYGTKTKCYGLFNSCEFVSRKLNELGIQAKTVQVIDNNCIDKHVAEFKPTHCFIEALWVVPEKFKILSKLHPKVHWMIRLHSMVPFLSSEGMAFEWIEEYLKLRSSGIDISISCNNIDLYEDLKSLYGAGISYSPNIYYPDDNRKGSEIFDFKKSPNELHVGCFGALRVLKNHTQQALWAMDFANKENKILKLHVNVSEHEQKEAGVVLRNMRAIFADTKHVLVEHPWYSHEDFLNLVRMMDVGMQVSFTETFNIVSADFVACGIPIVVSDEITFINPLCKGTATDKESVMSALWWCSKARKLGLTKWNKCLLNLHNSGATAQWIEILS